MCATRSISCPFVSICPRCLCRFEANAPLGFISFFEQRVRTHCCVQPLSHEMRLVYDLSAPLANNGWGYCQHSCPYQASREGQRSLAKITGKEGSRITGKENSSGQLRQGCCNLDLEQATGPIKGKRLEIYTFLLYNIVSHKLASQARSLVCWFNLTVYSMCVSLKLMPIVFYSVFLNNSFIMHCLVQPLSHKMLLF